MTIETEFNNLIQYMLTKLASTISLTKGTEIIQEKEVRRGKNRIILSAAEVIQLYEEASKIKHIASNLRTLEQEEVLHDISKLRQRICYYKHAKERKEQCKQYYQQHRQECIQRVYQRRQKKRLEAVAL